MVSFWHYSYSINTHYGQVWICCTQKRVFPWSVWWNIIIILSWMIVVIALLVTYWNLRCLLMLYKHFLNTLFILHNSVNFSVSQSYKYIENTLAWTWEMNRDSRQAWDTWRNTRGPFIYWTDASPQQGEAEREREI